ncbi:efflux transporter outer membrane subunit [Rhodoblastus sp.]|uniref:efflux transporter outer membrane subunit n=1 Tax=Rhodoblastus sp. TaxID=1962975 RepID=UPI0026055477|nr:efflux transporter outer membrane subunit [Rhodoblastus sp.]
MKRRMDRPVSVARILALAFCVGSQSGCEVGPDFSRPAPPSVLKYIPAGATPSLAPGNGEPSQRLVEAGTIPAEWWRMFRSASLDKVVREAIDGSPTLDAAKATLAQARQAVVQARGAYYPQVDFGASASRQRGPAFALGLLQGKELPTYSILSWGPTVSYSPDVFGLTARQVEKQEALAENQAHELEAARLTLTGNAVTQAIAMAEARQQIQAVKGVLADDEKNLALVRQQFALGKVTRSDVLAAETQLSNDRALLPPVEQRMAVAQDALAVLTGRSPAEWTPPAFDLDNFALPPRLPVSVPSTLVRRRPDILAAEAQLHAASAAVGVATAQMYPSFPLSASVGAAGLSTFQLFQGSSVIWSLAGGLSAPVFHGGALEAQKEGAIEAFRASLALYRQTVLLALGQVADTMRALGHDAELAEAERKAVDQAKQSLELQRIRYQAGKVDVLRLNDAARAVNQARLGYVAARAQRLRDSAQLLVAMGGGWWADPKSCADCREAVVATTGENK